MTTLELLTWIFAGCLALAWIGIVYITHDLIRNNP